MAEEAGADQVATRWTNLGGALRSGAAAASWGDRGETEIFAIRGDGGLWNRYWDTESWHEWKPLGGEFIGQPAAAARDADRIDIFAIGNDGTLRHRWWDGANWVDWRTVEGAPGNARAIACAWSGGRLDVFVLATDGSIYHADLA